jgi:predicted small integral membrane protein
MNNRLIKILFGLSVSLYMFMTCFNNLADYDSNFQFISMVSGMEDVYSKAKNGWRSVHSETLHHVMYLFIIACELTVAVLTLTGVFKMIKKFRSGKEEFNQSKKMLLTGLSVGVLLWFVIFITIGGEWFLMWQSKIWNGQTTAFILTIIFLVFLVHLNQPDD